MCRKYPATTTLYQNFNNNKICWIAWAILFSLSPFFFFFFLAFLGLYPWHMEVPRLGVKPELQLPAYTTATIPPDPSGVFDHTTAHGNTRSLTHWARPGSHLASSWLLVTAEPWQEIPGHTHFKTLKGVFRWLKTFFFKKIFMEFLSWCSWNESN